MPLPPISLRKGPVPIFPPNKKVKNFFNKLGTTVEITNEKLSKNFWSTSGMMAPFYELLSTIYILLNKFNSKNLPYPKEIYLLELSKFRLLCLNYIQNLLSNNV